MTTSPHNMNILMIMFNEHFKAKPMFLSSFKLPSCELNLQTQTLPNSL